MKVVCGWCGVLMTPGEPKPISHGICPTCAVALVGGKGPVALTDFIETFGFPIMVVDSNVELTGANQGAVRHFGKDLSRIVGEMGGDVLECVHASLSHGCGQTVHCKACTIRNSVTSTYRTGVPVIDAPAHQSIVTKDGLKRVPLRISTAKVSGSVLLKIVPG